MTIIESKQIEVGKDIKVADLKRLLGRLGMQAATTAIASNNFETGVSGWRFTAAGVLEAQGAVLTGSITATAGAIGGFNIGTDYVRDVANSFGLASTVTGGDDVRFWAGASFASRATAPFRVTESGVVAASSMTITGGSVATSVLSGTIGLTNLGLAIRGWSQTSAFSVTDADTVAWGSGTFTSADGGTVYSISAGNTGNMAAKTYIYLDTGVSTTVYQTTTTAATAVGAGKVLIAIAQNGTGEATFQVMSGQGGQNIDASSIVANSITANELSTSITYAGAIIIDTSGLIRSGQTNYNTGTGWWIGNDAGTPKFSIGDGTAANSLTWDGSTLTVGGLDITTAINRLNTLFTRSAFVGGPNDGMTVTAGTGTITRRAIFTVLSCANTAGSLSMRFDDAALAVTGNSDWDSNLELTVRVRVAALPPSGGGSTSIAFIGLHGSSVPVANNAFVTRHIGFEFYESAGGSTFVVKATNADGTTQTTTDITATMPTTSFSTGSFYTLRILYTAASSAQFYVNDVLVATHSTNLPSGNNQGFVMFGGVRAISGTVDFVVSNGYTLIKN